VLIIVERGAPLVHFLKSGLVMSLTEQDRLPLRLKLVHGLGSVAYGVKDNGFSTFLLIFYNQVIGLDAALVSLALMLALILDAFVDPVIGHLSDRTYSRWGRRHPWLYLGAIPLAFSWMLLWSPPVDHSHIFLYLVVTAILVRTLVSCCEVPSQSLVPELTPDYDERTSLTSFRLLFAWGGGLISFFLANAIFLRADAAHQVGQLNADGYWKFGLTGAILMAVSVIISALGQHKRIARRPSVKPEKAGIRAFFAGIFESLRHPAAVTLLGAGLIAITSNQMTFAMANFLYLFVWQLNPTAFAALPVMLVLTVIAAFFLAGRLHRRFGKRETALAASLIALAFWITPYALRGIGLWPPLGTAESTLILFAFIFCANVNSITVAISAQSMLADVVEASFLETGRRSEGVFTAGWVFVQKCGTAVGIGMSGLLVSWSGLPQKAVPGQVAGAVVDRLSGVYCLIIIFAALCAALLFRRFPISRADHDMRVKTIAENTPQ
jgi:glycoside/pentoside/hexuronide:cation symporter, GPH family